MLILSKSRYMPYLLNNYTTYYDNHACLSRGPKGKCSHLLQLSLMCNKTFPNRTALFICQFKNPANFAQTAAICLRRPPTWFESQLIHFHPENPSTQTIRSCCCSVQTSVWFDPRPVHKCLDNMQ